MAQKAYSIEDGNLQSKSIITTRRRLYSDLDLTFARAVNNDVFKKTDAAAVKQSVKNILLTNTLEKPFLPDFGGNLNDFLFELSEDFDEEVIEDTVQNAIQVFEPRARIIDVIATLQPDINDVKVEVKFQVVNTTEEVSLTVSLARLR
jgi:phage baseplate assembly protein W|tara:strand:- start:9767 stop:10210 length:444 start_codon:yes stop_codon:yes gene_type:complete